MAYLRRAPGPALAPFVDGLWYFAGSFAHARERVLPSGMLQLLVNLDADELRSYHGDAYGEVRRTAGAALCGAYDRHYAIDTEEQRRIVGVSFKPGGAGPFFAGPIAETSGRHVPLDDLWGGHGARLRERLLDAEERGGARAALATLETVLLERVVRPLERDPCVTFALAALRERPVGEVTAAVGLSPRKFIDRFAALVGLTPKRFVRVRRFQEVLRAIDFGRPARWAHVAACCGYFDQSHLIHDFRQFAGVAPGAYRARAPTDLNHVVLTD